MVRCFGLALILIALAGCSRSVPGQLHVGQSWFDAVEVARKAGYELFDAANLQMEPQPDGFYLELTGDRGLIVCRDPVHHTVSSISEYQNWSKGKGMRAMAQLQRFDLQPSQ